MVDANIYLLFLL